MNSLGQNCKPLLAVLFLGLSWLSAAQAQQDPHELVQHSLAHLKLSATPQSGPNTSVLGGVESQGTGFFVSKDGFLLTTRHVFTPLERVDAVNTVIEARVGDIESAPRKVQFVSDLPSLDLVLLKADFPFDAPAPLALDIGSSALINRSNPQPLFTSGFHGKNYRRLTVGLNDTESKSVPYAWTINVRTNNGQSGSPVYMKTGAGEIKVVGIVKATDREDDELTLMVPIEYSMPLIGHLKIQELSDRVDFLMKVIGEMTDTDMPLNTRVQEIEEHVEQIESHFTWTAESQPNGSIVVRYEKIINGGPQVDRIIVNMTPSMRFYDESDNPRIYTGPTPELRLPNRGEFVRTQLDNESGSGEFTIPNVATLLKSLADLTARAVGLPEPYRDVEIALLPFVGEQQLSLRKLTVIPDFNWDAVGSTVLANNE